MGIQFLHLLAGSAVQGGGGRGDSNERQTHGSERQNVFKGTRKCSVLTRCPLAVSGGV